MEFDVHAIRGSASGPSLLVIAGVHGDEFEPMVAVKRLRRLLANTPLRGEVVLIPVVNKSAWRRKRRTGEDGLDLARTFPGRARGSVTERVACAAAVYIRQADYLIDMHTGGAQLRLWPLTGYMVHAKKTVLDCQRLMARAFNLPVVWGSDPALNGRSLSVARDADVPAIYVEYLGAAPFCRHAVRVLAEGCLQVMAALRMIDRKPLPSQVRFWTEDERPGAGHLQVCHPAPHTGRFEPVVALGEEVATGQTLGWLHALESAAEPSEIVADRSGRVACLRLGAEAAPGDGLAVVVEFPDV